MALSLRELRRNGWVCDVVERRVPGQFVTHDFLGLLDIVAVRESQTLGVQATSASNVAARVKKLSASPNLVTVQRAGWQVEVWGWRKKDLRWVLRTVLLPHATMCNDE